MKKDLTIDERIDLLLKVTQNISDRQMTIIEEIKKLSDRVYDLEVSLLSLKDSTLPESNPIKLRLANVKV